MAFNWQTDGQMEWMNAIMEKYRWAHINDLQDDYSEWLPLAEFPANNQASETPGSSPFFADKGLNPRYQFDLLPVANNDTNDQWVLTVLETPAEIHTDLSTESNQANLHHQDNANTYQLPLPNYQNGDLIWLDRQNWKSHCPSKKLDNKWYGPFKILVKISPYAYCVNLPPSMKCHNAFHMSFVEPATDNKYPMRNYELLPPVEIDGKDEYFIEAVFDSRIHNRKLPYLIKWVGND
jgi:hypothetical protein